MAMGNFQIYSVRIIGKSICETFPPPLHDMIIRSHVKRPHQKFFQKVCSSMQSLFKKNVDDDKADRMEWGGKL